MIKYISFLLLLLIVRPVHSTEIKSETNGDIKKIYLDYNNDKKVDVIETYNKNVLIKKEQDLNFDGVFDEVTEYFPYTSDTGPIEVVKKSDRITKIYRNEKMQKMITTTEIDTDGDGKYDKFVTDTEPLVQKRDDSCKPLADDISNKLVTLSKNVDASMTKLNNGYFMNELGYKIHKSCLDNWGAKEFPALLSKGINTGMSCLQDLAKKNTENDPKRPNGALNNLVNLKRLLKDTPVTIICNEKYDWATTAGHASSSVGQTIPTQPNVKHPFLSLNPNDPKKKLRPTADETSEMSRTIFHEQLHNLGIRHGEGVEYPYSCETCCIPKNDQSAAQTASACKICGGQYDVQNKNDRMTYLKDFLVFGESNYNTDQVTKAITKFEQENPRSQWAALMHARSASGTFSATGIEMAKILKQKFSTRSPQDEENITAALTYQNEPHVKAVAQEAKMIAQANVDFYYDDSPGKTMDTLERNKEQIKSIILKAGKKTLTNKEKWTNVALLDDTKAILNKVFMKGYPDHVDEASSNRAYALLKEFKLD